MEVASRYWASSLLVLGLVLPWPLRYALGRTPAPGPAEGSPSAAAPAPEPEPARTLTAVTFANDATVLFVPARELADALGWPLAWNHSEQRLHLKFKVIPAEQTQRLLDGTQLVAVNGLREQGIAVGWREAAKLAVIGGHNGLVGIRAGAQRVAVNLAAQRLRAWQGERLVLETRVSTGAPGNETPTGDFTAGPLKARMVISRKYGNAEMPWTVQVKGNVCIHGHKSIPPRPASHGCIRMPLAGRNTARWFYDWIHLGTPIAVAEGWPPPPPATGVPSGPVAPPVLTAPEKPADMTP